MLEAEGRRHLTQKKSKKIQILLGQKVKYVKIIFPDFTFLVKDATPFTIKIIKFD